MSKSKKKSFEKKGSTTSKRKAVKAKQGLETVETYKEKVVESIFNQFVTFVSSSQDRKHLEFYAPKTVTLNDEDLKVSKGDRVFTVYVAKIRSNGSFIANMLNFDSMSINLEFLQRQGIRTMVFTRIIEYMRSHVSLKEKFPFIRISNSITSKSRNWMNSKGQHMGFESSSIYADSYELKL